MAKGAGTILYLDLSGGSTFTEVGCIYDVKPPGYSRGVEDGEACLGDTAKTQETGDLIRTPLDATVQSEPTAAASGLQYDIEAAIIADDQVAWAIKHPLQTPVYQFGTGKISEWDFESFDRDSQMKRPFQLLPDSDPTWSATPPTTS